MNRKHVTAMLAYHKKNYGNVKLILTQSYLVISIKASVNVIFDGGTLTFASVTTRVLG
jgi:hypothetical protein